jgi:GxxExxY protein
MELLHKDVTEKLIKGIYNVYNQLGYGYKEKEYQTAYAEELTTLGFKFARELYSNLTYNGKIIRRYFLDFLVDKKIVVELKVASDVYTQHFSQVLQYLKSNNLELGLIFVITPSKVIVKRVINQQTAATA